MPFFSRIRANMRFSPVIIWRSNKGLSCSTSTSFQAICFSIGGYCSKKILVVSRRGTKRWMIGLLLAELISRPAVHHPPPPPPPPPPPEEPPPPPPLENPPADDPGADADAETALENPLLKEEANAAGDEAMNAPVYQDGLYASWPSGAPAVART